MQSFSRRSRQQANDSRLKVVTWLVILVLIGLSVAWWWQSTARRSAGDDALAATEMSATVNTPEANVAPAVEVAEPVLPAASDAVSTQVVVSGATHPACGRYGCQRSRPDGRLCGLDCRARPPSRQGAPAQDELPPTAGWTSRMPTARPCSAV
jgi:hypothetical protein